MSRKSYTPPFESPPEEKFFKTVSPLLKKNAILIPQYEIETDWGIFRIDFMVVYENTKIAVECDGESVHGRDAQIYDNWRDIICLGEKTVSSVYRFSGKAINTNMPDIAYLFFMSEPDIFSGKSKGLLDSQKSLPITESLKHQVFRQRNFTEEIDLGILKANQPSLNKLIFKKISEIRSEEQKIYDFLLANKGRRINSLIYKYNKKKTFY